MRTYVCIRSILIVRRHAEARAMLVIMFILLTNRKGEYTSTLAE